MANWLSRDTLGDLSCNLARQLFWHKKSHKTTRCPSDLRLFPTAGGKRIGLCSQIRESSGNPWIVLNTFLSREDTQEPIYPSGLTFGNVSKIDHSPLFGTVSGLKGEWLLSRMEIACRSSARQARAGFSLNSRAPSFRARRCSHLQIEIDSTSNNSSSE